MIFKKHRAVLIFILAVIPFLLGMDNIYLIATMNDNGSGTIKLSYSCKESILKQNNFILQNFPFTEALAKSYFESDNSSVRKAKLDFSKADSVYFISLEIDFKDFNKLSSAKGFSNVNSSWLPADSGMIFKYIIKANPELYKNFPSQSYLVNFASPVKSSTGIIKGNEVVWGSRTANNTDLSKDVVMEAVVDSKGSANTKSSGKEEKKKSCGLFSIELPIIFLGMFVPSKLKRRKY